VAAVPGIAISQQRCLSLAAHVPPLPGIAPTQETYASNQREAELDEHFSAIGPIDGRILQCRIGQ
jgi:hypothetical protein